MCEHAEKTESILAWYDAQAREMPWRVPPEKSKMGVLPNPYHIWLSEVMLQQTTVAAVRKYFLRFTSRWPDIHALARAQDDEVMAAWAGLGYYARARNLLKSARIISGELHGNFPKSEKSLLELPGIGPYTAAAISAIAFGEKATVVDANVERVMTRMYNILEPLPDCKPKIYEHATALTPPDRAGDYAQAVMDLGATVCTQTPQCEYCPWAQDCMAFVRGTAVMLPVKRLKPKKPTRYGIAYFVRNSRGEILLETRPDTGLLGGMLCLPCSDWHEDTPTPAPPLAANWREAETIKHTFTHFHLYLHIYTAEIQDAAPFRGEFRKVVEGSLPTVMRKAYQSGISTLGSFKG